MCCFLVNANVRKKKVREGGFVPKFPSRHTCSTQSPHSYSTDTTPTRLHSSLRLFFFFFFLSFRSVKRKGKDGRQGFHVEKEEEQQGHVRVEKTFPFSFFQVFTSHDTLQPTKKKKKVKKRETDSKDPFIFFLGGRGSESRFHYLTTKRKKRKKTAFFYLLPFRCFDRWRLLSLSFLIKCF